MRILLDGRDDVFIIEGPTKFKEFWNELLNLCSQSERDIDFVKIDGKEISPSEIETFLEQDINQFSIIEIETRGREEDALDELVEANQIIEETKQVIKHFLESGSLDYNDVVMSIISALNSWERACRKIDSASKSLGIDYTQLQFANTTFSQQQTRSMEIINRLSSALSTRDIITLRDLLEYEFLPQIETYTELIKGIIEKKGKILRDESKP